MSSSMLFHMKPNTSITIYFMCWDIYEMSFKNYCVKTSKLFISQMSIKHSNQQEDKRVCIENPQPVLANCRHLSELH